MDLVLFIFGMIIDIGPKFYKALSHISLNSQHSAWNISWCRWSTCIRVATHSGKHGKQGKWWKKIPCRKKSGNLKFCWKSGKNQGISKNLIFVRSKYSNFIAVQMWLLVVSFCHMLKMPADLILLEGGVLVRWSTCLLYILFFLFLIPKWTFYCKPNVCH